MKFPSRGLYAITQTAGKSIAEVLQAVEAALKGGAAVIQYRDKTPLNAHYLGSQLVALCHTYHAPLLVNDHVDLALEVGADGVHLGREDGDIELARQRLGPQAIIGVSCYNDLDIAKELAAKGCDYVAFGRFFPSNSKPLAKPAQIETLHRAKQCLPVPIVAIGGILPENAGQLLTAGADLLAVIGGVFDQEPEKSARAFQSLFKP